ncbi:MAG: FAD-dependent thymidylate synthase [Candidatus Taylorbacteria bacterium]|nr:FAD-dependent thymidylate synthase [Candidatus Taylorbacteria bacterium]
MEKDRRNGGGEMSYPQIVLDLAKVFVLNPLGFHWTSYEKLALGFVFTNLERRVFFMFGLPANVGATVLAMYSRIKNKRGIRGIFVDTFLPQFLATKLSVVEEKFEGDEAKFLKENKIRRLDDVVNYSEETKVLFIGFVEAMADPEYMASFADSKKTRVFLKTWLDKYGHNSIARTANLWICCEMISIMAAKSLEWNRPGSGFIELSTRYVDMSGKDYYPVQRELAELYGINPLKITSVIEKGFELYRELAGDNFDGPFPRFLRERFGHLYADDPKGLEAGIIGETCDVLGNLLPCATLTSVGMSISGEALPKLLSHLILDNTPENLALVEAIIEESKKVGGYQFVRHYNPSEWEKENWRYLPVMDDFLTNDSTSTVWMQGKGQELKSVIEEILNTKMESRYTEHELRGLTGLEYFLHKAGSTKRGEFDKLPREFEVATVLFQGTMSFRGWRDLERQGFCTHFRSMVTPNLGFYRYDKPAPAELSNTFDKLYRYNYFLYQKLINNQKASPLLLQYILALGNMVMFEIAGNLRQFEFCNWQRSKWGVNHEVRRVFVSMERELRSSLPWWVQISRADITSAYVFARGETPVVLEK